MPSGHWEAARALPSQVVAPIDSGELELASQRLQVRTVRAWYVCACFAPCLHAQSRRSKPLQASTAPSLLSGPCSIVS